VANNNWVGVTNSWSLVTNWSLVHVPTTDEIAVFASGFSNVACTIDANVDCSGITVSGTYTAAMSANGYAYYLTGNYTDDGAGGTRDLGSGMIMSGPSSTIHLGSTLGTITATSCDIRMNTLTAGVIDDDKGTTFKSLTLGASAIVTNNGASTSNYSSTTTPLTFTNGGTLTISRLMQFVLTGSSSFVSITGTPTIDGAAQLRFYINANGMTGTIPALTRTGNGAIQISASLSISGAIQLTGNLSLANNLFITPDNNNTNLTFNDGGNSIKVLTVSMGSQGATQTTNLNFSGSHILSFAAGTSFNNASYNAGTTTMNLNNSMWALSGSLLFPSTHTVNPGTSLFTAGNAGTYTVNGKSFYDFNVNTAASGTLVTFADTPKFNGDFTVTQGSTTFGALTWSGLGDVLFDGTGNHTIGSGITLVNPGTFRLNSTLNSCISAGCYVKCNDTATLTLDGRTLNRLGLTTGKTYTWTTGTSVPTINTYTAGDWDGTTLVSSTPTSQWKLKMVPAITIVGINVTDSDNSTGTEINADATSVNGGNNLNWVFASAPGPTASGVQLIEMRFYNPFLHTQYIAKGRRVLRAVQRYIGS
jgi:hypothetical protein